MIVNIRNISGNTALQACINYNEKKLSEGIANVFLNNTMSVEKDDRIDDFKTCQRLNTNVRKNFAFEITFNMRPGEVVEDDKFKDIINDYLEELNYDNSPFIAYQHNDKRHNHVHLYVSQIDWDGNKVDQSNIKYRSQKYSRVLEEKYNLIKTEYNLYRGTKLLSEINHRKYYVQNALKKGLRSYNTKSKLETLLSESQISKLKESSLTNQQVGILLGDNKNDVLKLLDKHSMFNTILKDELYKRVEVIYKDNGNDMNEYFNQLQNEGIYVRKVFNKKGEESFEYGLEELGFYIEDHKLGNKFTYSRMFGGEEINVNSDKSDFTMDQQREYIYNSISKVVADTYNLTDLSDSLAERNIETITYQNKRGIYGIAFKSLNASNPVVFKGSELGMSWNDFLNVFENNSTNVEYSEDKDISSNEIDYSSYSHMPTYPNIKNRREEEDNINKKKKKRRGRNL